MKKKSRLFKSISLLLVATVFFTNSYGQTWSERTSSLPTSKAALYLSIVDDNTVWTFAQPNNFSVSTNGGTTFTNVQGGPFTTGTPVSSISAISATTAYFCAASTVSLTGVYKTIDSGVTWTKQASAGYSDVGSYPDGIHFFDTNNGLTYGDPTLGYFEIYTTSNGGANWVRVPSSSIPAMLSGEFEYSNLNESEGNSFWFSTNLGRVFHSTDKGLTWSVYSFPIDAGKLVFMTFSDINKGIVTYVSGGILKMETTTDGGTTYSPISFSGITNVNRIEYIPGTNQIVAKYSSGSLFSDYFSGDNGVTWTSLSTPKKIFIYEFSNSGTGYAGTFVNGDSSGGIYKFVNTISLIGNALEGNASSNDTEMITSDGINYSLSGVFIAKHTIDNNYFLKIRQNKSWNYNWGTSTITNEFPIGTGILYNPSAYPVGGVGIAPNDYGYYDVAFNRVTGGYTFQLTSQLPIGIYGTIYPTGWTSDVKLTTFDGDTYLLSNQNLALGSALFREGDNDLAVGGGTTFPSGNLINGGASQIPVPAGTYNVHLNRLANTYNFESVLGVASNSLNTFHLYPNPTHNRIQVSGINSNTIKAIEVYDSLGKKVYSGANSLDINVQNLQSGLYFLRIQTDDKSSTLKFIKS